MVSRAGKDRPVIHRRALLQGAAVGLGVTIAGSGAACARSRVAVVKGDDHLGAVDRALGMTGFFERVVRGDEVLLKVNTNSGDPYPYSTSPELVRYLCRQLRDRGAVVTVGDRSFWGDGDTAGNLERNGIADAAKSAGARVRVFDDAVEWVEIAPALVPSWRPPVRVPRMAVEAAHLVNLPCLKTHFITGATLALKNFLGLIHAQDRARPGNLRSHDRDLIHVQVAEIHRGVRASLHLVDGHKALVAGGPTPHGATPRIARLGTVIASTDPVATDAVALAELAAHVRSDEAIFGVPPWDSPILRAAVKAGIGATGPHAVDIERG